MKVSNITKFKVYHNSILIEALTRNNKKHIKPECIIEAASNLYKDNLRYNNKIGKTYINSFGTIAEYTSKKDIPKYTTHLQAAKEEFTNIVRSNASVLMKQ